MVKQYAISRYNKIGKETLNTVMYQVSGEYSLLSNSINKKLIDKIQYWKA